MNFVKLSNKLLANSRIASVLQKIEKRNYVNPASTSGKIDLNGTNIYYETTPLVANIFMLDHGQAGNGNHVLVCLPGTLGFSKLDFGAQLKNLNKEKFTVVAFDPPGHGPSRKIDGFDRDYSGNFFERDAKTVSVLMQKLGHEKYSAFGWSQGGISAVHLAANFPQNVEKLITLGTFAFVDKTIMSNDRLANVDTWSPQMKDPFISYYGEEYTKSCWNGWVQALLRMQRENDGDLGHLKLMELVKCPTLIVQGAKDPICPTYHAEYLHKMIPNSTLHMFPAGSHNLHLHPRLQEEFNTLIENFLLHS